MKHFIHPLKIIFPIALILTTVFITACTSTSSEKYGRGSGPGGKPPKVMSFTELDSNGDGYISKSEFKGPSDLFEKMDTDNDDLLSEDELEEMPEPPQGRPPKR